LKKYGKKIATQGKKIESQFKIDYKINVFTLFLIFGAEMSVTCLFFCVEMPLCQKPRKILFSLMQLLSAPHNF